MTPKTEREWTFSAVCAHLRTRLSSTPPDLTAKDATPAAVLVPLVPGPEGAALVVTRRSNAVRHHKNQLAFPGGAVESGDPTVIHTALREAEEEVGIPQNAVTPLGFLPVYHTVTGFAVAPLVAAVPAPPPRWRIDPREVAAVFTVDLARLAQPATYTRRQRTHRGRTVDDHRYATDHGVVWGATGAMIHALLRALQS